MSRTADIIRCQYAHPEIRAVDFERDRLFLVDDGTKVEVAIRVLNSQMSLDYSLLENGEDSLADLRWSAEYSSSNQEQGLP